MPRLELAAAAAGAVLAREQAMALEIAFAATAAYNDKNGERILEKLRKSLRQLAGLE